jgi:hypothetical protein
MHSKWWEFGQNCPIAVEILIFFIFVPKKFKMDFFPFMELRKLKMADFFKMAENVLGEIFHLGKKNSFPAQNS